MDKWGNLASEASVNKAVDALMLNGITTIVVNNGAEAKQKVLDLVPHGAEVLTTTSVTLDTIGITHEINESGKYDSIKSKLLKMDHAKHGQEIRRIGAAPDWVVGSVHAVTEDGKVIVASATGSQLPSYAYGAGKVIWVVGTQKIVKNEHEGMLRLQEHTFPLEDARAQKAYGVHSSIAKVLVISREFAPGRITVILVKENLGF